MARTFFTTTLICALTLFSGLAQSAKHDYHKARDHAKFHPKRDSTLRWPYGSTKVRGVNIGGWLVLESWMTPTLFANTGDSRIVDEYTFGQYQDVDVATAALKTHWDTWITEDDFVAIAAAGLNHVRIPIGYWAFDVSEGEPYLQGQYDYLKLACQWAANHGIKVLVDLHGAPNSQNGFDNSGRLGTPQWQTSQDNVDRTIAVISTISAEFAKPEYANVVTAIEDLNEPTGYYSAQLLSVVTQYHYDAYGNIHFPYGNSTEGPLLMVIHDAFQDLSHWNGYMAAPGHNAVMMDTHYYQMFDASQIPNTPQQHITNMCNRGKQIAAYTTLWTIVGEWTTSTNDCPNSKNIRANAVGSHYDGTYPGSTAVGSCIGLTGDYHNFSAGYLAYLRQIFEAQTIAFETGGQGWVFWAWKTESTDEWSYQKGLEGGWIPEDPTDRQYPNICAGTFSTSSSSSSHSSTSSTTSRASTSTTSRTSTTSTTSTTPTTTSHSSTTSTTSTTSHTSTTSTTSTTSSSSSSSSPTGAVIHPGASATKCLTAASNANNAVVEIEDCDGSAGQSWSLVGGTLQTFGNKCLDVTSGSTTNGNKMQIYTCTSGNANQQFTTTGNTVTWAGKGECLDLTGGSITNGNVIQMWTCTGGVNQVWNIVNGSTSTTSTTSHTTTSSTTSHTTSTTSRTTTSTTSSPSPAVTGHVIHPGASATKCLTAASNANGGQVTVQDCVTGSASQAWTNTGGTLVIYGSKCLDVTNGSTTNGNKLQIWACGAGNANQQFTITTDHRISWTNKGECIDLTDGKTTNGNLIQLWTCTNNDNNQVWNLI